MGEVITIGLDLAENVFQVHGVDASGEVVIRKRLRRRQVMPFFGKLAPCLIGVEACATCHHWARALEALGFEVRIISSRSFRRADLALVPNGRICFHRHFRDKYRPCQSQSIGCMHDVSEQDNGPPVSDHALDVPDTGGHI